MSIDKFADRLFAQFPFPPPPDIEMATTERITAVRALYTYTQPTVLDCYELVLVSSPFPSTRIGSRDYHVVRNRMFAVNPGQVHHVCHSGPVPPFFPVFFDCKLMTEVSREVCGRDSVTFKNDGIGLNPMLLQLVRMLIEEGSSAQPGQRLVLDCLSTQITALMLRNLPNNLNLPQLGALSDRRNIRKAIEYMHSHHRENFSLEQIAQAVNYSPYYFIRVFKSETGKTPFAYLTEIRIHKAMDLLKDSGMSVTDVCFACGFNNLSHFITVFKQKTGVTPSCYQKSSK